LAIAIALARSRRLERGLFPYVIASQTWMLNEINALIWPSPGGVGVMDTALWDQTVEIATSQGVLAAAPTDGAYRTDIAEEAVANLEAAGIDVNGADSAKLDVEVTEGGE
jgi:NitT/TauT family transport system substrate-binding protein